MPKKFTRQQYLKTYSVAETAIVTRENCLEVLRDNH